MLKKGTGRGDRVARLTRKDWAVRIVVFVIVMSFLAGTLSLLFL